MIQDLIPINWVTGTLGTLVVVERGSSPRPIKNFITNTGGVNWIKIGDMKEGQKFVVRTAERITVEGALKSRFVGVGDFILSNSMSFGRPYIMATEGYIHDGWFALRLPSLINSDYFYYLLSSSFVQDQFQLLAVGGIVKNISGDLVKKAILPLPPLAEQKVIADKLDTLLAQVEATKARLERIPEILKRFRQSVLSAAVTGKLTEEWREGKDTCWSVVTLAKVCSSVSDGDHQAPPRAEYGIPFLVISNISNGKINFDSVSRYVPEEYYETLKDIRKPEVNDILYTVTGSFGIPVVVNSPAKFCFQRHIAIIKPDHNKVNYRYLSFYLASPDVFKYANSVATGTAQKTVSLSHLRKFSVNLPTFEEQTEIVHRVEELFAFADNIEQKATAALERVNNLTQSILAKAFRGELTADWRAANSELISGDNSAEALLAKIKAERAALVGKKTRKKA